MNKKHIELKYFTFFLICLLLCSAREIINKEIAFSLFFDYKYLVILSLIVLTYILDKELKEKSKKIKWFLSISTLIISTFISLFSSLNILSYIIEIYILLFFSFVVHKKSNLTFSLSIGLTTSLLLILLLVLGCLNLLPYTKITILIFILLSCLYLKVYYSKHKNSLIEDINTYMDYQFLIFCIFSIMAFVGGFERYVHVWDEYNMWALSPKKVILTNSLSGLSYPPMTALFAYFISLFDSFKEQNLYIANSLFIYIYLMAIFTDIKDKKMILLTFLISISFCYLFGDVYNFNNVYADLIQAICFGYCLICMYKSVINRSQNFAAMIVTSIILTLIKPQGFICATTLYIIAAMYYILNDLNWKSNLQSMISNLKKSIKKYWFLIIFPVLLYLFWAFLSSKFFSVPSFDSAKIVPPGLDKSLLSSFNVHDFANFILNSLEFLDGDAFKFVISFSVIEYLIIVLMLLFIYFKKIYDRAFLKVIPFLIGIVIFYGLTLLSLAAMMPVMDAVNLASLGRYLGNFNVAIFMFILWLYFVPLYKSRKISYTILVIVTFSLLSSVPIKNTFYFALDLKDRYAKREIYFENINKFNPVLENTEETDKIYIIDQKDENGFLPSGQSQYYLFPRPLSVNGSINWRILTESNKDYAQGWELTAEKLEKILLKEKFDYMFLYSSTDEFFKEISFMLDDVEKSKSYSLFEIKNVNQSIKLVPVKNSFVNNVSNE